MRLGLGRRDVADRFEKPSLIKPVDPFQRGDFDRFHGAPTETPQCGLSER